MRDEPFDTTSFVHEGQTFTAKLYYDHYADPPWDSCDGHGPVRASHRRHGLYGDKRPGERPLNDPDRNEYQYYYDWQAAAKLARQDGWNAPPCDASNRIARAVEADFQYLRRWLRQDWFYIGVVVEDSEGNEDALWGVDYDPASNYHEEIMHQIADELLIRQQEQTYPVAACGV